ncbi:uncharacterized protein LOC143182958 isoform X2 [Calliopsis andreniformis]|uniref:uncharacterized protein LOC143182958 isoform X2 n=1 Tax=Calliopsis andreniformis TaxID=337506 RepID=UPI003FCCD26D
MKIQQELVDALTTDESLKEKRPFCNAFTGCGKKRSFRENSVDSHDMVASSSIQLPLPVYRALLRVAAQNVRNMADRETNEYQLSGIPQVYLSRLPLHKRLDNIPLTSLN